MHIAFVHDAVIPPPKYGGTERIVYWLIQALHELGHKTTLIAKPGSQVPGTHLICLEDSSEWNQILPSDVDVVHLWSTPGKIPKKPYLVTIEGNGRPGETFHRNTVFISRKHAENHSATTFVYNGIDPGAYPCDEKREDRLVFLAKASWDVKNLDGAIRVAQKSAMPLHVLGSRDWPLGLHKKIPRLISKMRGVQYYGMVGDAEKKEVLRKSKALIFPVRWHEPFGIAITEALASGCAVMGTPYGSLPEIITSETGFLSSRESEIVEALRSNSFDPKKCRARVFEGFTHLEMAKSYVEHYKNISNHGFLKGLNQNSPCPKTRDGFRANELLPWNE